MAIKHYNNDPAKARSRDMVKGMLENTVLKEKPASEVRVICFPGIDAREVYEVYDEVGIPRENVTGLEMYGEIAGQIASTCRGINVVNASAENYFASIDKHNYDVVSLDFTGPINQQTRGLLRNVMKKQELPAFLMHTAHSMRRDKWFYQEVVNANICEDQRGAMLNRFASKISPQATLPTEFVKTEVFEDGELKDMRALHYSTFLRTCLLQPSVFCEELGGFLFGKESYGKILSRLRAEYNMGDEVIRHTTTSSVNSTDTMDVGNFTRAVHSTLFNKLASRLTNKFGDEGKNMALPICAALMFTQMNGDRYFTPEQVSKYSYISESGTPMNGDILYLTRNLQREQVCGDLAESIGYPNGFNIARFKDFSRALGTFKANLGLLSTVSKGYLTHRTTERVYLGNSRTMNENTLGRRVSSTIGNLLSKFVPVSGEKPVTEKMTLTKEEAVDMLGSNIPIKEILEAYPGSFTEGQLRAYKAWITMRAKQEQEAEKDNAETL